MALTSCNLESNKGDNLQGESSSKNELMISHENLLFEIGKLTAKINDIEKKNGVLENKIDEIEFDRIISELDFLKENEFLKFKEEINQRIIKSKAIFNLKKKQGFYLINSSGYTFCVSVENVQPYLDGFKVIFTIGNPSIADFSNPKIHITWNKDYWEYYQEQKSTNKKFSEVMDLWEKSQKQTEITILKDLRSGVWNRVEVLLTPATLDELEYVELSMETNTINLYKDTSALN